MIHVPLQVYTYSIFPSRNDKRLPPPVIHQYIWTYSSCTLSCLFCPFFLAFNYLFPIIFRVFFLFLSHLVFSLQITPADIPILLGEIGTCSGFIPSSTLLAHVYYKGKRTHFSWWWRAISGTSTRPSSPCGPPPTTVTGSSSCSVPFIPQLGHTRDSIVYVSMSIVKPFAFLIAVLPLCAVKYFLFHC